MNDDPTFTPTAPVAPAQGMSGKFRAAIEVAIRRLAASDPLHRAAAIGAVFADGGFHFRYLGMQALIAHPTGACFLGGRPVAGTDAVLLLHYVLDGKNVAPAGEWISYREVPDAAAYLAAYQARGPALIARTFADRPEAFGVAAQRLGARPAPELPGAAYVLPALPRLPLALIFYEGEPGLPADAQILFDATAPAIWCAEDLAVLGEMAAAYMVERG
jgi:hypothetical protein